VEQHQVLAALRSQAALLVIGLLGCSSPEASREASAPEPAVQLVAHLASPVDVVLEWTAPPEATAAGRVVEFATEAQGPYTILEFVPPGRARFEHENLIPETSFYYRVRSFYGPASSTVEVRLPGPRPEEDPDTDDGAWALPRTLPPPAGLTPRSIRGANVAAGAAPTDLQATLVSSTGVKLTWTDRASDEEGYLIEVRAAGRAEFRVAAVVDPDVNCFGLVPLPDEKQVMVRVRAFYYGKPSNLAHQTTGTAADRLVHRRDAAT
jgi:hypothetical protein